VAHKRRKFSPQFKAEAVQFVLTTRRPAAEVARELEINEGTLGNWVNEWPQQNPEPEKALTPVERARVAAMEDEIRRLRLENELLKMAAARAGDRCQVGVMPRLARMVS
jgi:transposase-like protein